MVKMFCLLMLIARHCCSRSRRAFDASSHPSNLGTGSIVPIHGIIRGNLLSIYSLDMKSRFAFFDVFEAVKAGILIPLSKIKG